MCPGIPTKRGEKDPKKKALSKDIRFVAAAELDLNVRGRSLMFLGPWEGKSQIRIEQKDAIFGGMRKNVRGERMVVK